MSWDRYEYDEQSSCACGKGIVIKHCYREDDDWNRSREGCTGIDIQCPECKKLICTMKTDANLNSIMTALPDIVGVHLGLGTGIIRTNTLFQAD